MRIKLFLIIGALAVSIFAKFLYNTTYSNFTLTSQKGTIDIGIPHSGNFKSNRDVNFTVEGNIYVSRFSSSVFRIIPDDEVLSITVNQQLVDLSLIPKAELSSWNNGFKIDLGEYLNKSQNSIKIEMVDKGGRYGLLISNAATGFAQAPYWIILCVCISILAYVISNLVGLRKELCIAVTVGVLLRWFYVLITGFDTRGHDTWEHLDYIMHFTKTWALPDLNAAVDGAYFHPPFYYWLNSIIFEISQLFSPNDKEYGYKWLQYASFTYSAGFLIFSAKLIDLFFQEINTKNPNFRSKNQIQRFFDVASPRLHSFFALLCLSVWPGAILHSSRIGNDPLLYFLFIAACFYIYKFYLTPKFHLFLLGATFTALAVITKANAAVLGLGGAGVVLYHWSKLNYSFPKKAVLTGIIPCLLLLGSAALTFYPGIALKMKGERTHLYIDNIDNVSKGLQVGDEVKNFLWLDLKTFINEPFTSPWDDKLGRQYFANYLGKTSLFGEWSYEGSVARNTAMAVSFFFIIIMSIFFHTVYSIRSEHFKIVLPIVAIHLLLVLPIYYMRITFPVNIDFRYIIPSLVSLVILYNYGLWKGAISNHRRFSKLGLVIQSLFILSSIGFISHFALK